jgi:2-iminobutanoate/2-iminopropanoate deaminase
VIVSTPDAPAPAGAYAQAVVHGDLVFVSGQLPIDPAGGGVPESAEAQIELVFDNVEAVLRAAGSSLDRVLKAGVYLTEREVWEPMNEAFARRFGSGTAARTSIVVGPLAFGAVIEVDVIAHR